MTYNVLVGTLNPTHSLAHSPFCTAILYTGPISELLILYMLCSRLRLNTTERYQLTIANLTNQDSAF